MRKSSQNKNPPKAMGDSPPVADGAKPPSRERGRQRVAALLGAAAQVFAQKGYAATTMTEVAAMAESSIGSLYQFFPTKEALADGVLQLQIQALAASLEALQAEAAAMSTAELAAALCDLLPRFRRTHPSFIKLMDSPAVPDAMGKQVRAWIRTQLVSMLRAHFADAPTLDYDSMGLVVHQAIKAAAQLWTELNGGARERALAELRKMLQSYLASVTAQTAR